MRSQWDDFGMLPPLKDTLPDPTTPVTVPPPHWGVAGAAATYTFAGRASVIDTWVRSEFGSLFQMVIVRVLVCPIQIVLGAKVLLNVGGCTRLTVRVALASVELVTGIELSLASVAASDPAKMVFFRLPAVIELTSTVTEQDPGLEPTWAGTVPPLRDTEPPTALTIPPQVVVVFAGLAT